MTLTPLNDAIRLGPEYQEPARDQQAFLKDGSEVVVQCTLSRTAVLRRPGDFTSRWLERLDQVLVDAATLRWQPLPDAQVRQAGARGRSRRTIKPRSRALKICRQCKRDSFQTPFHNKGDHGNLCIKCVAGDREKHRKPCVCGCGVLARPHERYASIDCARRHQVEEPA